MQKITDQCHWQVPGKIKESIIKEQVVEYLNNKDWLSISQHGFVKGISCLINLLEAFEAWTRLLDEGHGINIIFWIIVKRLTQSLTDVYLSSWYSLESLGSC